MFDLNPEGMLRLAVGCHNKDLDYEGIATACRCEPLCVFFCVCEKYKQMTLHVILNP